MNRKRSLRIRNSHSLNSKFNQFNIDDVCNKAKYTIFPQWITFWGNRHHDPCGDVHISIEDHVYQLESHYLSFWSDGFLELFHNSESGAVVMLPGSSITISDFETLLNYLYNGVLHLDENNLRSIIIIGNRFKMHSVVRLCCNYFIENLRNLGDITNVIDALCHPSNLFSLKIFMPHLIQRWDKIQSHEILRAITFDVFKIVLSNEIPRHNDEDFIEICLKWVNTDIDNRFNYIPDLIDCITGKFNHIRASDSNGLRPKDPEDVKRIFYELLYRHLDRNKIDFVNYFGLIIKKNEDRVDKIVNESESPHRSQVYFEHWSSRMKALRHDRTKSDITVQVDQEEYPLNYWILTISSKFFQQLPSDNRRIVRLNLTKEDFLSVLNFMYGKTLHISADNIYNILRAGRYLEMNSCLKLIVRFIRANYRNLDMLRLFDVSSDIPDDVYRTVKNLILKNFSEIKIHSIFDLKLECLKTLISSKTLRISCKERLNLCRIWILHDVKNRYLNITELTAAIKEALDEQSMTYVNKLCLAFRQEVQIGWENYNNRLRNENYSRFGRPFTIAIPRINFIEYVTKNKPERKFGVSFYIELPRLKVSKER